MAETKTKTKKTARKAAVKKAPVKKVAAKKTKTPKAKIGKYFEAVGRRKTSVARVRIFPDKKSIFTVNGKALKDFFGTDELATVANAPLRKIKMLEEMSVSAKVLGGGIRGQAEAVRHGIARALEKYEPELRLRLKKSGYLKRDPRAKERKKYGLRGARRAPQFSKR
jgi:small subunit ribosomal protein S9